MQYSEYIASDNARREREIQLANQYNQQPEGLKVKNLWMHSVERQQNHTLSTKEVIEVIAGFIIVGIILAISIFIL